PKEHEATRPDHALKPCPDGLCGVPPPQLVVDRRVEPPHSRLQRGGDFAKRLFRLYTDMLDLDVFDHDLSSLFILLPIAFSHAPKCHARRRGPKQQQTDGFPGPGMTHDSPSHPVGPRLRFTALDVERSQGSSPAQGERVAEHRSTALGL